MLIGLLTREPAVGRVLETGLAPVPVSATVGALIVASFLARGTKKPGIWGGWGGDM